MDVAKRLKELRMMNNLTATELATRCNLQQATMSKLENNKRAIDIPTLSIICEELNITLAEFFYYESMPTHLYELVHVCKDLTPEQVKQITLTIKALRDQ